MPRKRGFWVQLIRLISLVMICLGMIIVEGTILAVKAEEAEKIKKEKPSEESLTLKEKWGVEIVGVRLTANAYMLDFRYRVIDSDKAIMFTQKQVKPYLIDQASGKKLDVARTRLGPMRQTAVKPTPDRNYAILFANSNKLVKAGSKVTVVIGDFKVEDLVVE